MTIEIVPNTGQFGAGRMAWLLVCDDELIAHCALRYPLEDALQNVHGGVSSLVFPARVSV